MSEQIFQKATTTLNDLQGKNFYERLQVIRGTDPKEIKKSYNKLVAQWHPDRYLNLNNPKLIETCQRIMALYNEAHGVLSNDKKRADYDASLDAGKTGTIEDKRNQVDASAIFNADTSFRRGQQALERGQIPKARDLFESAFKGNPGSGEYEVYYKYCVALDDKLTDSARRKIMDEIDVLANKAANFDMAFYFLGELHIKNKNNDRAKACFQKALALNSKNFMASRQLRLLTMRDTSSFMDKLKSMFKK